MMPASRIRSICLIAALGLLLALPFIQILQAGERLSIVPNLEVDARAYDTMALTLSEHPSPGTIPIGFSPGFVAVLAAVYATAGHSFVAAKMLLWLSLVIATVGAGLLAVRIHGAAAAGWTAALLTASSPALQAYTGTLQYEVFVACLLLLLIAFALSIARADGSAVILRRSLLLGAGVGLAVLVRESLIALVPVFALFAGHQVARTSRVRVAAIAAVVVFTAGILPAIGWSAYQSRRAGHAMLIRDNVQGLLPIGHNPNANGTWNGALTGIGQPAGIEFVLAEPRRELWLVGRKAMYFWGVLRDGWNVPRPAAVWLARATAGVVPLEWILAAARGGWILVAVIVACCTISRTQWRAYWLLPAAIAALMAVHLVTIASHRFAVPILPLAFVLVAGFIAELITRVKPKGWAVIAGLLIAGLAMQMRHWPVTYRLDPTELDGVNGENRHEPDGRAVRFSDAAGGRRVSFALYDDYLPAGPLVLRVNARRGSTTRAAATPVGRIRLFLLDRSTPCVTDVTVGQMPAADRWTQLGFSCVLPRDGTARLIVETFGRVDLSFSDVRLQWLRR